MMNYKLIDIEGIGPEYAQKLEASGLQTTDDLLARTGDAEQRAVLAASTGIGEALLTRWAQMADLMRLKGIGPQYSELLLASGVQSLEQLAARQPAAVLQAMIATNEEKRLARATPALGEVENWFRALTEMHSSARSE